MTYTGVDAFVQLLRTYTPVENKALLKEVGPFTLISFLVVYACLLITDGYYFLVFLLLGFSIGLLCSSHRSSSPDFTTQYDRNLSYKEQTLEQFSNSLEPAKQVELYYPPLTIVVNQLLDYVMRDFVSSWWTPINAHHDPTFERLARERLNVAFLNVQKILLNQERNDIVMSTLYGVANTLIIHMRECRALEESELSMEDYVVENPQSPFAQLLDKEEQHRQLRALSQIFLKRTLPSADRDSLLLTSLFKELLANFLFGSILDSLSDPDFLNCWIVDFLSDKENAKVISSTVSAAADVVTTPIDDHNDHNDDDHNDVKSAEKDEDEEDPSMSIIRKSTEDDDSSLDQVTPPGTPEPFTTKPSPLVTSPKQDTTLLASLQSPPPARSSSSSSLSSPVMIFNRGSVNFTIMDISAPQLNEQQPLNKRELVYIIQIERPAMEDHAGSEGGGYVITRTYADFETFNAILHARHAKRAAKLQLRLPLDDTASKSWLIKKPSVVQQRKKVPLEAVGMALEKYIDTVVQDDELGTDQIILPFLRKERRADIAEGTVTSFADEYKNEAAVAAVEAALTAAASASAAPASSANSVDTASISSKSRSLFSRSNTINASPKTLDVDERQSIDFDINNKWFAPKQKTRQGSVSSMQSSLSRDSLATATAVVKEEGEDAEPEKKPAASLVDDDKRQNTPSTNKVKHKPLSPMDVELLIETTYALVVEIFNLTTSNNKAWMRRSILNLLREIVRRSYAQFISEQYADFVQEYMSPDAIVGRLNQLGEQLWPEGKWMLDAKEQTEKTRHDKEKSKQLARTLLMTELIPNAVRQLIGDQNCNTAMDRIWARCQDPNLNRVLVLQLMERIIKPILG
ncbi:hypothetical protein [Parasitella parasitica]|uniref:PXA domain-containing protein n=1 Tax=Parasitella parasitica TaxID=35722 RepID=A0A0B7NKP6_9FUNG|nr:hypothetical protein [Parasitella parasitica]